MLRRYSWLAVSLCVVALLASGCGSTPAPVVVVQDVTATPTPAQPIVITQIVVATPTPAPEKPTEAAPAPVTDLTALGLTAEDVKNSAPCSREAITYNREGPNVADAQPWIDAGAAPAGTRQMATWYINEWYSSPTTQHDLAGVMEQALEFSDEGGAAAYLEMWAADRIMTALAQAGSMPAGWSREEMPVRTVGDQTLAYRYTSAEGQDSYTLVFCRGNVAVWLSVGAQAVEDCSLQPGMPLLESLAAIVYSHLGGPTPSPPQPPASTVSFYDDFSADKGWANETGGDFVLNSADGYVAWHVDRSVDEYFYIPLELAGGDVRFEARVQATSWGNNCNFYFGLAESLSGWQERPTWPAGLFVDVGWFGAGVGNRIAPLITYADRSDFVWWDAGNPATYISYEQNRWYRVGLTVAGGQWTVTVRDDAGNEVGRLSGNLPAPHSGYRYFVLFNPKDGDRPTGDGLFDDLSVEGMAP